MPEVTPFFRICVITAGAISVPAVVHAALFDDSSRYFGPFYTAYCVFAVVLLFAVRVSDLTRRVLLTTAVLSALLAVIGYYAQSL